MKKTMQELIVGHYEGSLTSSQEKALQSMLATSPEARALYEQHGAMQEVMEEESERLAPPIALREATIGAALAVGAEAIGGGLTAWLTTKMAVAIGSVVVGGAAAGIILSTSGSDNNDTPKNPPAAVSAPVGTTQESNKVNAVEKSVPANPAPAANTEGPSKSGQPSPSAVANSHTTATGDKHQVTTNNTGSSSDEVSLGGEEVTKVTKTRVQSNDDDNKKGN